MQSKELGDFVLWRRRNKFEWSAKDLAQRLDLDPSQISRLEHGQQKEPILGPIARVLQVRPGIMLDLFEGHITLQEAKRLTVLADHGVTNEIEDNKKYISIPDWLPDEDIARLHDYINILTERRSSSLQRNA